MKGIGIWVSGMLATAVIAAAPATAAEYYVDAEGAGDCTAAGSPCPAVGTALALAAGTPGPDTIHVGRASVAYPAIAVPDSRLTFAGDDYEGVGGGDPPIVDGAAQAGFQVAAGDSARTIRGFTIRGGDGAGLIGSLDYGGGTGLVVEGNRFDELGAGTEYQLRASGSPEIRGNEFFGPGAAPAPVGVNVGPAIAPAIEENDLTGFSRAINLFGDASVPDGFRVAGNDIQIYVNGGNPDTGIFADNLTGLIARNTITGQLVPGATSSATGVFVTGVSATANPLRFEHNRIASIPRGSMGNSSGVQLSGAQPVTMFGDVISGHERNLRIGVTPAVSLTNVTFWGASVDEIADFNAAPSPLAIDSSLIGDAGITADSCSAVTYSRGPANLSPGCVFQTAADPAFTADLRLAASGNSAFIDLGNPASPGAAVDIDGDRRALDGISDGNCAERRDIGADERDPSNGDCPAIVFPPREAPRCDLTARRKKLKRQLKKAKSRSKRKKLKRKLRGLRC